MNTPKTSEYTIQAVIDRFEGSFAILVCDDGQKIHWQKENLPSDAHEGSVVHLALQTSEEETKKQEELAKTMLNEILNSQQHDS